MTTSQKPLLALTAGDVMKAPVEVIPLGTTLRTAAHQLRHAGVSGAPVVDEDGRCVGVLSAADFLRWAEHNGPPHGSGESIRTCLYQKDAHRAGGEQGVLCTLPEGNCPLQAADFTDQGDERLFCLLPHCILLDWQQVVEGNGPGNQVEKFMTQDVVTVEPAVPLARVARMMVDAHIHRVVVVDEQGRPVGIVSSTDVLAVVARAGANGAA